MPPASFLALATSAQMSEHSHQGTDWRVNTGPSFEAENTPLRGALS